MSMKFSLLISLFNLFFHMMKCECPFDSTNPIELTNKAVSISKTNLEGTIACLKKAIEIGLKKFQ